MFITCLIIGGYSGLYSSDVDTQVRYLSKDDRILCRWLQHETTSFSNPDTFCFPDNFQVIYFDLLKFSSPIFFNDPIFNGAHSHEYSSVIVNPKLYLSPMQAMPEPQECR